MSEREFMKAIAKWQRKVEQLRLAQKGSLAVHRVKVREYTVREHTVRAHTRVYYRRET